MPAKWIASKFVDFEITCRIWIIDAKFAYRQELPLPVGTLLIAVPAIVWERFTLAVRQLQQNALFTRYLRLHTLHYGPTGRGYQNLAAASPENRSRRYHEQTSRLEYFVDHYSELLRYKDGDSFLDFGCGTGQNIRMLSERYPSSRIVGYDINPDAVSLIREFERNPAVMVATGDLVDDALRAEVAGEGFNHIILSHVFSLIFGPAIDDTIHMRQRILSELADACSSSLVIVDTFGAVGPPTIAIEQRQRAIVTDDVLGYFSRIDSGRAYLVQSDRSRAVVFTKKTLGG